MSTADEAFVSSATASIPVSSAFNEPTTGLVSRRQRFLGLVIVLAVAFTSFVATSLLGVVGVHFDYPDAWIGYRYFNLLIHELLALGLLAYVVSQNRQSLAGFGAGFQAIDIAYGILLWMVTECSYWLAFPTIMSACEFLGWHKAPPHYPSAKLGLGLISICFVVINPVFEEMIVRAFLMTETMALTGSSALAILLSFLLQTTYHLYQGLPYALSVGAIFLIYSLYYARTHRILPVIIAHFMMDISFVLSLRSI